MVDKTEIKKKMNEDINWDSVISVLKDFAIQVSDEYKSKLPRSSGELYDSVSGDVVVEGNVYKAIINLSEIWRYVEYGRKAGKFPPPDAIKSWIRLKPITPQPFVRPNGKRVIPTENQLAFLIGRKIATKGISPRPYLLESVNALKDDLLLRLSDAIGSDIIKELMIEFKR